MTTQQSDYKRYFSFRDGTFCRVHNSGKVLLSDNHSTDRILGIPVTKLGMASYKDNHRTNIFTVYRLGVLDDPKFWGWKPLDGAEHILITEFSDSNSLSDATIHLISYDTEAQAIASVSWTSYWVSDAGDKAAWKRRLVNKYAKTTMTLEEITA